MECTIQAMCLLVDSLELCLAFCVLNFISSSGLTISGGEPFLQAEELYSLLSVLNLPGGVVLFSGFDIEEILGDESKRKCLPYIDL